MATVASRPHQPPCQYLSKQLWLSWGLRLAPVAHRKCHVVAARSIFVRAFTVLHQPHCRGGARVAPRAHHPPLSILGQMALTLVGIVIGARRAPPVPSS